jgi:hypothetical protein
MKNTVTQTMLNILFAFGGVLGICLYNPTINLFFKGNFLATMLKTLHLSPSWKVLVTLIILLTILGLVLNLQRKWIKSNINSTDKVGEITLSFMLKTMAVGFVFPYIFISTTWVIVMILIKVFLMK